MVAKSLVSKTCLEDAVRPKSFEKSMYSEKKSSVDVVLLPSTSSNSVEIGSSLKLEIRSSLVVSVLSTREAGFRRFLQVSQYHFSLKPSY